MMEREVKIGVYLHFKKLKYEVIGVADHSETGEKLVVYRALYGDRKLWVRPKSNFLAEVDKIKYPYANQKYKFEFLGGK